MNIRKRIIALWRKQLRNDYRAVFIGDEQTPSQLAVLQDLRSFCYARKRTATLDRAGRIDTHAMALAEGRREVWNLIDRYLHLTDDQLARMELQDSQARSNVERDAEREQLYA